MATALGGLVIIGVMIAGVFFTSNQELRVGTNTFVQERAFRAAEFGVNASLASWDNAEMLLLPIGNIKQIVYDSSAKGWRDTVTITRLNATSYMIASTGMAFGGIQGTSRRRTALLVRLSVPSFNVRAAMVSGNETSVEESKLLGKLTSSLFSPPKIVGDDTDPPGWTSCPPPEASAAAVAVADKDDLDKGLLDCLLGNLVGNCPVKGAPMVLETAAAADTATFFQFGDESWSALTTYGAKVYSKQNKPPSTIGPSTVNGVCDRTASGNWGDPSRNTPAGPCESYFPIIHAQGKEKVELRGGSGQGILLVEGDLEIRDDFEFYGPIIVRGKFESRDDAEAHGTILAANIGKKDETRVRDNSSITYSSCAIKKAFEHAVPPKRMIERAWLEVF